VAAAFAFAARVSTRSARAMVILPPTFLLHLGSFVHILLFLLLRLVLLRHVVIDDFHRIGLVASIRPGRRRCRRGSRTSTGSKGSSSAPEAGLSSDRRLRLLVVFRFLQCLLLSPAINLFVAKLIAPLPSSLRIVGPSILPALLEASVLIADLGIVLTPFFVLAVPPRSAIPPIFQIVRSTGPAAEAKELPWGAAAASFGLGGGLQNRRLLRRWR